MPQAGIDPLRQDHAIYEACALPLSHHGWIEAVMLLFLQVTECEAVSELAASEELTNAKKAMQEAIEHFKAEWTNIEKPQLFD